MNSRASAMSMAPMKQTAAKLAANSKNPFIRRSSSRLLVSVFDQLDPLAFVLKVENVQGQRVTGR